MTKKFPYIHYIKPFDPSDIPEEIRRLPTPPGHYPVKWISLDEMKEMFPSKSDLEEFLIKLDKKEDKSCQGEGY